MRVLSVPSSVPFLRAVVAALVDGRLVEDFEARARPERLTEATLYLPTRRAGRLVREIVLEELGLQAVLLPRIRAVGRPVLGNRLYLSAAVGVDGRLVGGAGLFGIGWGLCGYCPGPAISALVLSPHEAVWVVGGRCAGFAVVHLALERPLATKIFRTDSKHTA
jgi:hypothetical protein